MLWNHSLLRLWIHRSITLILFILTLPAFGQEDPRFLIETIIVENANHFSPSIVVAESLLEEGRAYSEIELRDAIHRIIRLPLILDASFNLRKGTERNHFELVITVEEARRWFFGEVGEFTWGDNRIFRNRPFPGREPAPRLIDDDEIIHLVGHRTAIGAYGVISAAVNSFDRGGAQLGYTQNNLFGRNVQLNLQYLFEPLVQRSSHDHEMQTTRIELGVPLWGNHSLWFQSSYRNLEIQLSFGLGGDHVRRERNEETQNHSLSWVFNTLDDPVFPRSGTFFRSGLDFSQLDYSDLHAQTSEDSEEVVRSKGGWREHSLFVSADHYWTLNKKDSVSVSLDLVAVRNKNSHRPDLASNSVETDYDEWEGRMALGYSRFLYRDTKKPRWRELRWENRLEYRHWEFNAPGFQAGDLEEYNLSTGLKFRTSWGVFGLTLNYLERPGDL